MEVMLSSLRQGRVDDLELLDRYVLGVCRNVAHALRRSGERTAKTARRLALEPAPSVEQPPEPPWGKQTVERLTTCMNGLSERERRVVHLSFSPNGDQAPKLPNSSKWRAATCESSVTGRCASCVSA
jgi:DNA-directed RNA polymerase specialized sigma24 family protein